MYKAIAQIPLQEKFQFIKEMKPLFASALSFSPLFSQHWTKTVYTFSVSHRIKKRGVGVGKGDLKHLEAVYALAHYITSLYCAA